MKRYIITPALTLLLMAGITYILKEPPAGAQPAHVPTVTDYQTQQKEAELDKTIAETKGILKKLPEPPGPKPKVVTRKVPVPPETLHYYYRIAGNVYQGQVKKDGGFYVIDIDSLVANAKVTDTVILHHTDTVYLKKHGWLYKMFHKK